MKLPPCTNCEGLTTAQDLLTSYQGKIISAVCRFCLSDVKKPRLTFTRPTPTSPFTPEQYACVEIFR